MKTEKIARLNLRWFSRLFHRALRQPEPAPKAVAFGIHAVGTVSETVSESRKRVKKNCAR
jgi:hypothetical protein